MAEITLGHYLFERLKQVQVETVFGLPGDFNLSLLDKIYEVPGMRWAGNANELNAAYAADGYARLKGMGCLITTFGVGELSALNGIAGSYAEHVGVLHVVGVPSISSQARHLLLHHTLGNGDFTVFHRMSSNISVTTAFLTDIAKAAEEIDRCIIACKTKQRPVYLAIPANLVDLKVSKSLLDKPLKLEIAPNENEAEMEVIENVLNMVSKAKNPIILADACCTRHDVTAETGRLIDITQFPTFVTPMGKGAVDETHPRFVGVYVGTLSDPKVKSFVESSDLILSIGALLSDFNTGSFSYSYKTKNVIEFHSDYIKIKNATFQGVAMKHVLHKLLDLIRPAIKDYDPVPIPKVTRSNDAVDPENPLSQEWIWNRVSAWFKEGDVVITETGTSAFGINQSQFNSNVYGISQVLYGSIGYTTGATLGAAFAAEEIDPSKRVILFIGDGSLQLTVQEISTMVKWGLKPYLFVLNNDGYTIERLIHGQNAQYNDIQGWDHTALLPTFGAKTYDSLKVKKVGELESLFCDAKFNINDKIRLIEVFLERLDAPLTLVKQAQLTAETNKV